MTSFHMNMLDRRTKDHEITLQTNLINEPEVSNNSETKVEYFENQPQAALKPGLNMVSNKSQSKSLQSSNSRPGSRDSNQSSSRRSNRKFRSDETQKVLKQYEVRERQTKSKEQYKKEKLLANAMSSKSDDALTKARERFLARKKQVEFNKPS